MNIVTKEEARKARSKSLFVDSTPLLEDLDALRKRADEDGYLFLKHFLPAEPILALRAELLAVVGQHGWRQPGQGSLEGRIDLEALNQVTDAEMRNDIGVSNAAYEDAQRLERFHALPHHPRLVSFYQAFFGREVLVHPRHIIRMITGHRIMVPTPPGLSPYSRYRRYLDLLVSFGRLPPDDGWTHCFEGIASKRISSHPTGQGRGRPCRSSLSLGNGMGRG